eukprot:05726_2
MRGAHLCCNSYAVDLEEKLMPLMPRLGCVTRPQATPSPSSFRFVPCPWACIFHRVWLIFVGRKTFRRAWRNPPQRRFGPRGKDREGFQRTREWCFLCLRRIQCRVFLSSLSVFNDKSTQANEFCTRNGWILFQELCGVNIMFSSK